MMLQDTSQDDRLIQLHGSSARLAAAADLVQFQQHVKTVMKEGCYYAWPLSVESSGTVYQVVQLLSCKPASKKYMERVVGWSPDKWQSHIAVARLATFVAKAQPQGHDGGVIDLESKSRPCAIASDQQVVASTSAVEAVPLQQLFMHDFDCVYEFQQHWHTCQFSAEVVAAALGDSCDDDGVDASGSLGQLGRGVSVASIDSAGSAPSASSKGHGVLSKMALVPDIVFALHCCISNGDNFTMAPSSEFHVSRGSFVVEGSLKR